MPEEPVKLDETMDAKPYEAPKPGRREIIRVASVIFVLLAVTGSFLGKCAMRQRRLAAERREAAEEADRERAAEKARQWGQRLREDMKQKTLLSLRISSAADFLESESAALRKYGATELGEIGAEAQHMRGELTKLAAGDPDPEVRAAAAEALKKMRGEEPGK
jgi:HEAT repeat protein